ncbi:MAG: bifunctional folylpolyglutamate synthase/dihydrofolate synthase [bacterium]|nr:bifunctional folylpolyglutamate synthase/dihydrofolate synthase [bacterium]
MAEDLIDWLYDLQHFGIKLGLDNIRTLLRLVDHPQRAFSALHVAGTNGKGSVAAMAESILGASGVRTGLFTSPHLVRPHERIRLAGADIDDDELQGLLAEMRELVETAQRSGDLEFHPSFFEVITTTALEAFRRHRVDAAVLEVGLGGRLDATNAIDPTVTAIVGVALDHTKTLGPTLEKIAAEKAGIIKTDRPLISGVTQPCALRVVQQTCRERGAPFVDARLAARFIAEDSSGLTFETDSAVYDGLRLGLGGRHQIDNARVALVAYEHMMRAAGRTPDVVAVRRGLGEVRWAGRLQRIESGPDEAALLLDAAHNPAGLAALDTHLKRNGIEPDVLLFGATTGKPLDQLLEPFSRHTDRLVLTRPPVKRGIAPDEVRPVAEKLFDRVDSVDDPAEALERAKEIAGKGGLVLVSGSLYLVGTILGLVRGEHRPRPMAM